MTVKDVVYATGYVVGFAQGRIERTREDVQRKLAVFKRAVAAAKAELKKEG